MIDIYCENNMCPICNSEMIFEIRFSAIEIFCKNGCYEISKFKLTTSEGKIAYQSFIYIFKEHFGDIIDIETYVKQKEKKVIEKILSWKENDRYLVKILAEG